MKKAIIFDFNRTLFDPDKEELVPGAREFLETRAGEFLLGLVSKGSEERKRLLKRVGIDDYFRFISMEEEKSIRQFQECLSALNVRPEDTWSIGDRTRKEIRFSNQLGLKTIWLRQGKFAEELPETPEEEPDFTVVSFEEISELIR